MRWVVVAVAVLAGCAYKAASSSETTREVTSERVGCLDVGIDRRGDLGNAAVVRYAFENHCAQPASVDLAWASVIGRTAEGAEIALVPTHKQSQVTIAAHGSAETTLAYPAPAPIGQLCVDVASLAQQTPTQWRCFGDPEAVASR